eukprot:511619-Pleurochrysis_carterae.AAC.1
MLVRCAPCACQQLSWRNVSFLALVGPIFLAIFRGVPGAPHRQGRARAVWPAMCVCRNIPSVLLNGPAPTCSSGRGVHCVLRYARELGNTSPAYNFVQGSWAFGAMLESH